MSESLAPSPRTNPPSTWRYPLENSISTKIYTRELPLSSPPVKLSGQRDIKAYKKDLV